MQMCACVCQSVFAISKLKKHVKTPKVTEKTEDMDVIYTQQSIKKLPL